MDPVSELLTVMKTEWYRNVWPGGKPRGIRLLVAGTASMLLGVFLSAVSVAPSIDLSPLMVIWAYMPLLLLVDMVAVTFGSNREAVSLRGSRGDRRPVDSTFFGKLALPVLFALMVFCTTVALGAITILLVGTDPGLTSIPFRTGFWVVLCVLLVYEAMAGVVAFIALELTEHRLPVWIVRGIILAPPVLLAAFLVFSTGSPLYSDVSAFADAGSGRIVLRVIVPLALLDFTSLMVARSAFHRRCGDRI